MLYSIFTYLVALALPIIALFNKKMRIWYIGRRGLLKKAKLAMKDNKADIIWFHCASLGEFEQAREVIEEMRRKFVGYKMVLTFFSPSGYVYRKDYEGADYVLYLPLDTPTAARRFVRYINPKVFVLVKYDYWSNILYAIKRSKAKLYVISAIFNPQQYYFKWYNMHAKNTLGLFNHIFVQNVQSMRLLSTIGITNVTVAGDTRFDRVYALSKKSMKLDIIEKFKENENNITIVAGSTWRPDEKLLVEAMHVLPDIRFIIAPHEITDANIQWIVNACEATGRTVSLYTEGLVKDSTVLILNTVGALSSAYKYGDMAYVGGGFGVGIHNTLEPATYGIPMAFGPNYKRFAEAIDLINIGGAECVNNDNELIRWMGILSKNSIMRRKRADICRKYVEDGRGATNLIMKHVLTDNNIAFDKENDYNS